MNEATTIKLSNEQRSDLERRVISRTIEARVARRMEISRGQVISWRRRFAQGGVAAIDEYVAVHNDNPKSFIWTAKAHDIMQKVIRANQRLGSKKNEALH